MGINSSLGDVALVLGVLLRVWILGLAVGNNGNVCDGFGSNHLDLPGMDFDSFVTLSFAIPHRTISSFTLFCLTCWQVFTTYNSCSSKRCIFDYF